MSKTLPLSRRGMILILSSPSGAGKTTLTRMLLQDKNLDLTAKYGVPLNKGVPALAVLDSDGTVRTLIPVQQAYYPDKFVAFLEKVIADVKP